MTGADLPVERPSACGAGLLIPVPAQRDVYNGNTSVIKETSGDNISCILALVLSLERVRDDTAGVDFAASGTRLVGLQINVTFGLGLSEQDSMEISCREM